MTELQLLLAIAGLPVFTLAVAAAAALLPGGDR